MTDGAHIEPLGSHNYLIKLWQDDDAVEIRVRATPDVVARISGGGGDADEERIVEDTIAYLLERQRADELPPQLDLDDIAATYDDYIDSLHGHRKA